MAFFSESGCKDKESFGYPPNFRRTFFLLFFRRRRLSCERGGQKNRKGNPCLCLHHFKEAPPSFPKAGAKVAGFHLQAKHTSDFFQLFLKVFTKRLVYRYVLQQVFQGRERAEGNGTPNNINAGARERDGRRFYEEKRGKAREKL